MLAFPEEFYVWNDYFGDVAVTQEAWYGFIARAEGGFFANASNTESVKNALRRAFFCAAPDPSVPHILVNTAVGILFVIAFSSDDECATLVAVR